MSFIEGAISGAQAAQGMKLKREEANRVAKESEAKLKQANLELRKGETELQAFEFKFEQLQNQQSIKNLSNYIMTAARTGDASIVNNYLAQDERASNAMNMLGISKFVSPGEVNQDTLNIAYKVIMEGKGYKYEELSPDIIEEAKRGSIIGIDTGGNVRVIPLDEMGVFMPDVGLAMAEQNYNITNMIEKGKQAKLDTAALDQKIEKLSLENAEAKKQLGLMVEYMEALNRDDIDTATNILRAMGKSVESFADKQKREQAKNRQDALNNGNLVKAQANSSKPGDITTMTDDFSTLIKNKTGKNPSELTTEQYAILQQNDPSLAESASYIKSILNKDDTTRERQEKRIVSNKELPKSILNIKSSDTGVFDQLKSGLGAYVRDVLDLVIDRIPINAMNIQNQQILQVLKTGSYISNAQAKEIQKIFTDNNRGYKDVQDKLIAIAQIMQSVIEYQQQDELGRFATARDHVYIKELIMMAKENIKLYDISSDLPDSTVDRRVEDGFVIFTIPDKNKKVASTTYSGEELEKLKKDKTKNYIIDKVTGKLVSIAELEKRNGR